MVCFRYIIVNPLQKGGGDDDDDDDDNNNNNNNNNNGRTKTMANVTGNKNEAVHQKTPLIKHR